jgi:hypothetical protein
MKYLVYVLLILLLILSIYYNKLNEGFTVYEIDYGTGIGPWWAQGAGLNRGFHRCICSGTGDCHCINDNQFKNTSVYPQYYFN